MVINSLRRLVTGILNLAEMVKIMMLIPDGLLRRNQTSANLILALDRWYIDNPIQNLYISRKVRLLCRVGSKPSVDTCVLICYTCW